jgi:hypothetical protein
MQAFHNAMSCTIVAALILLSSFTAVSAQVPGGGLGSFGGEIHGAVG